MQDAIQPAGINNGSRRILQHGALSAKWRKGCMVSDLPMPAGMVDVVGGAIEEPVRAAGPDIFAPLSER